MANVPGESQIGFLILPNLYRVFSATLGTILRAKRLRWESSPPGLRSVVFHWSGGRMAGRVQLRGGLGLAEQAHFQFNQYL
ncbi:MAG: hypothetical protein JWR44_3865 [Hymenobacter sp.]|jgi:hypothetical protein|nr:hypothetical protein [Hymenobacter sp.]